MSSAGSSTTLRRSILIGKVVSLLPVLVGAVGLRTFVGIAYGASVFLILNILSSLPWLYWVFVINGACSDVSSSASPSKWRKSIIKWLSGAIAFSGVVVAYSLWEMHIYAAEGSGLHPRAPMFITALLIPVVVGVPACLGLAILLVEDLKVRLSLAFMFVTALLAPYVLCLVSVPLGFHASNSTASIALHLAQAVGLIMAFEGVAQLHSAQERRLRQTDLSVDAIL